MKQPAVYILTNKKYGTLYIGVTSALVKRIWQHKNNIVEGFTAKYQLHNLVYFEIHTDMYTAISREKQLKKWRRSWKIDLIEKENINWNDLYPTLL
ncbi:GIY-YIG nuclease family protein [Paraglaciecola arctica]|uniref:GIY-YIG nuclease family protein n=1 Tax=Paraglaciecola arctica TaxID=1128911 RepID=UPI001C069F77|nr:GIY-YIG nuclease family protein [Paraglaciecola arctica]MBU3005772.1 GIY-YIG nuclease family protein [Paraglaciecola arctica]